MNRTCGDCTLCCSLLPVEEINKKSGQRCMHQRHRSCGIYADRPLSCRVWSCAWLVHPQTAAMSRPDRSHYVIDTALDYIRVSGDGLTVNIPAMVVWVDPQHPEAHTDPHLRALIDRAAMPALVRYSSHGPAKVLFPPSMTDGATWRENESSCELPPARWTRPIGT